MKITSFSSYLNEGAVEYPQDIVTVIKKAGPAWIEMIQLQGHSSGKPFSIVDDSVIKAAENVTSFTRSIVPSSWESYESWWSPVKSCDDFEEFLLQTVQQAKSLRDDSGTAAAFKQVFSAKIPDGLKSLSREPDGGDTHYIPWGEEKQPISWKAIMVATRIICLAKRLQEASKL